jgi:hypothetical protein
VSGSSFTGKIALDDDLTITNTVNMIGAQLSSLASGDDLILSTNAVLLGGTVETQDFLIEVGTDITAVISGVSISTSASIFAGIDSTSTINSLTLSQGSTVTVTLENEDEDTHVATVIIQNSFGLASTQTRVAVDEDTVDETFTITFDGTVLTVSAAAEE